MNNFGVYVHFPYCRSKCPYCDFYSRAVKDLNNAELTSAYVSALQKQAQKTQDKVVSSIFFGGGTPSLASADFVETIIKTVQSLWQTVPLPEISLEGNPDSLNADKMLGFKQAGVNRLSVGVQSLKDDDLKFLGRRHNAGKALETLEEARKIYDNLSADFIYALPNRTNREWREDLQRILSLNLPHLSLYQLALEEGSFFYKQNKITLLDEETAAFLFELTGDLTAQKGYDRYEVSNFAQNGYMCRHNLLYWTGGEYVGVGAGACGRYETDGVFYATQDVRDAAAWLKTQKQETQILSKQERAEELILTGLRLKKGISRAVFKKIIGRELDSFLNLSNVRTLCAEKLIVSDSDSLRATDKGVLILNYLITELLL